MANKLNVSHQLMDVSRWRGKRSTDIKFCFVIHSWIFNKSFIVFEENLTLIFRIQSLHFVFYSNKYYLNASNYNFLESLAIETNIRNARVYFLDLTFTIMTSSLGHFSFVQFWKLRSSQNWDNTWEPPWDWMDTTL